MGYRNHCNRLPARHYTGGKFQEIPALVSAGTHSVQVIGNSREGFNLILATTHDNAYCTLGGTYTLRRDAISAARRAYNVQTVKHSQGYI